MHDLVTSYEYPLFEGGQTLTAAELNALQEFLHDRDRLIGRMVGFGINCGLGGAVVANDDGDPELVIDPGLAIDQYGEPLMVSDPWVIGLPPTAQSPSYEFIDGTQSGYSVVLEMTDVGVPAPDCGEVDCTAHADLHTVGVAVRTVAGRVTGTYMDFTSEMLLTKSPILLALDGTLTTSYTALRNAIADRLTNGTDPLVDPALIALLRATSVSAAEAPAIKGYKAGWLNLVLFATLDLLRAISLFELSCDRSTPRPGVVVGWVHFDGAAWLFDCRYRHAWEPPRGFSEAFFGGTCTDPLSRYRDQVEALLAGFAPPDPVPPPGPLPEPTECPYGTIRVLGNCVKIYLPPPEIDDHWYEEFIPELDPLGPYWNPPPIEIVEQPWLVYDTQPWNTFQDGVIAVSHYTGQPADEVQNVLTDYIGKKGGVADVRVIDAGTEADLAGFLPAAAFSPSDTGVIVQDAGGLAIGFGRVAALNNVANVGNALPAATAAIADAQATAVELHGLVDTVEGRFTGFESSVEGLSNEFGVLKETFNELEVGAFDGRVSTLEGQMTMIQRIPVGGTKGLDVGFGRGLVEFTETAVAAMESLGKVDNPNFERYLADTQRAQSELEVAVAAGDVELIGTQTLKTLRTMRTMLKASGAAPELGSQLDAQLRELGGMFG